MSLKWLRIAKAGTLALGTVALVGLALLSVITRRWGWSLPLELLSHFQVQYFAAGLLLSLLLLWLWRFKPVAMAIAIASMVVLSSPILPWFLPTGTAIASSPTLKLLFSNVYIRNQETAPLLALVEREDPDIIALAEVSPLWDAPLALLSSEYPFQAGETATNPFGLKVLSKFPLNELQLLEFANSRTSLAMQLEVEQRPLTVVVTHPVPPVRPEMLHSRNRQLANLATYLAARSHPTIVIGDFNITPWSPYYQRFIQETQLHNTRKGFGILPTWPVASSESSVPNGLHQLLSIPIDHCLVDPTLQVLEMHTGATVNSDHRPIVVTLALP
jgi:endonuclease/exonuclease/phosphatase (EEP) superfamily protein YafD